MTALTDLLAARAELHASSYWKPGSRGWSTTHLAKCDAALAAAIQALQPPPVPPPPPVTVPAVNPVPPPTSGVALGAYIEGRTTYAKYFPAKAPWSNAPMVDPGTSDAWTQFELGAGKKLQMLLVGSGGYDPWNNPNGFAATKPYLDLVIARNTVPVLDTGTGGTLADYTAGRYDTAITAWAKDLAAWGHPIVFRFNCEMNGGWYSYGAQARTNPAAFVAVWRRFHDLFAAAGAANVSWHWCPNIDPDREQTPLEALYPGDAYVDWTGFTGYDHTGAEAFEWLFRSTYNRVLALAPSKPMMIGEIAATETPTKADFIRALAAALNGSMPAVRAFFWFNWLANDGEWPIESSPAALAAFRALAADPGIIGRP